MNTITKKLALVTVGAAILATVVSTNANAGDVAIVKTTVNTVSIGSNIALVHPACLTAGANATLTVTNAMNTYETATVSSTSPNTAYTQSDCKGYIVDAKFVSTPGNYYPVVDGGLDSVPNTAQACEFAQYHISYYRKAANATDFTHVGGGFAKGSWTGSSGFGSNTCNVGHLPNFQNKTVGVAVGDTWRIVVRGVEQAQPAKVKVTAGNMQQIH